MQSSYGRGPAIAATAVALALVNLGLAGLITLAVGARTLLPPWAALGLLVLGILATLVTVLLWRAYLRDSAN